MKIKVIGDNRNVFQKFMDWALNQKPITEFPTIGNILKINDNGTFVFQVEGSNLVYPSKEYKFITLLDGENLTINL